MATVQGCDYPDRLLYDIDNQIWYEPLADGTVRVGFMPFAVSMMGEVLVFTPKRIGRDFEKHRSFATIEGGKWVGSARAAFAGIVVASNDALARNPELMMADPFGAGWMLIVRPGDDDWRAGLATGATIAADLEAWIARAAYKDHTE